MDGSRNTKPFEANRYYDRHFEREAVKILPGEYYATKDGTLIVTVLGSCVSACLQDRLSGVAGMNHFLLPNDSTYDPSAVISESARYGVYAMELLINQMLKLGAKKENLEAKIFGGGNVLRGLSQNSVGERNAEFVVEYLQAEHIPILASDLLDQYPRKVYLFSDIGEVKVRKLKSLHNSTILDRESEYRVKIKSVASGDVDLF